MVGGREESPLRLASHDSIRDVLRHIFVSEPVPESPVQAVGPAVTEYKPAMLPNVASFEMNKNVTESPCGSVPTISPAPPTCVPDRVNWLKHTELTEALPVIASLESAAMDAVDLWHLRRRPSAAIGSACATCCVVPGDGAA